MSVRRQNRAAVVEPTSTPILSKLRAHLFKAKTRSLDGLLEIATWCSVMHRD